MKELQSIFYFELYLFLIYNIFFLKYRPAREEIMKTIKIFAVLILLFILSLPFWLSPQTVHFKKDFSVKLIINQLLILLLIALFLERALDVFLTTWRAQKSEELENDINKIQKKLESKPGKTNSNQTKELEQKSKQKLIYRAETRKIALWSGLILGILISAAGVRTISNFFIIKHLNSVQKNLFIFLDVFMTGGLISGGSDGIHKITEFLRNFLETSTYKAKKERK